MQPVVVLLCVCSSNAFRALHCTATSIECIVDTVPSAKRSFFALFFIKLTTLFTSVYTIYFLWISMAKRFHFLTIKRFNSQNPNLFMWHFSFHSSIWRKKNVIQFDYSRRQWVLCLVNEPPVLRINENRVWLSFPRLFAYPFRDCVCNLCVPGSSACWLQPSPPPENPNTKHALIN